MRARDALTDDGFDVRARLTLNATGSFSGRLMNAFGLRECSLLRR
jgi:glycerol-3-phosphate dehydrogenase